MDIYVDTAKVKGRRHVHFDSIEQLLEEIKRVREADRDGSLETLGNWSAGQIMAHVAAWIEYGYQGYPTGPFPFPLSIIMRWMGRRIIKKGMQPGLKIPRVEGGTYGQEKLTVEEASARLEKALLRLQSGEACQFDSPAFGPMSHADRIELNLRHAELHFGFLRY